MKPETIAIHLSNEVHDTQRPVIQPITLSTTYLHGQDSLIYSRFANPNRKSFEQVITALEYGKDGAAFSSGNTAAMAVFQSLSPRAHLIAPQDMYHGLKKQLTEVFKGKLSVTFVDMTNTSEVEAAITPNTELIWIETPSNPLIHITDIPAISKIAKRASIRLVCDNTFATPILQNPLQLGADIVMHSATKYLGGHSDILAGILITKETDSFWETIKNVQSIGGAVPSPLDCYLLCRSVKTLPYRMRGHCTNAMELAKFLDSHPAVEKVYYPGLASDKGHMLAKQQMRGFGGMVTFLVNGKASAVDRFVSSLKYFSNATSLGGVESLIERRALVEGPGTTTPENLVRMSVGLESAEDLIADLEQGFSAMKST